MDEGVVEGIYNPFLAICGIVLIPVLIWWIRQHSSRKTKLFGYFLILFFAQGSLELLDIISPTILRYAFEIPLVTCYLICYFRTKKRKIYGGRILILPFIAVSIVSGVQTGSVMTVLFLLYVLETFMMLFFFINTFNSRDTQLIHKLFILLAVAQIPASFIKFALVGVMEPYIGTMSSHAGGITTLFALAAFCVSLEIFLCTDKRWILLLALGFVLFGFIGEKRALAFFIPIFYIITVIVNTVMNKAYVASIKLTFAGIVLIPLLFIVACVLNPSLNPEGKVGGSFDLGYVIEFSDDYNAGNDYDDSGRSKALSIVLDKFSEDNLYNKLFGYGAGTLVSSRFNEFDNTDYTNMQRFGVGYSKNVGLIYMLLQVGVVGTLTYFGIFIALIVDLCRRYRRYSRFLSLQKRGWVISSILILICAIVISILYNHVPFYLNPCSLLVVWIYSYSYKLSDYAHYRRILEKNSLENTDTQRR